MNRCVVAAGAVTVATLLAVSGALAEMRTPLGDAKVLGTTQDALWRTLDRVPSEVLAASSWPAPGNGLVVQLDLDALRERVQPAPEEFAPGAWTNSPSVDLPLPDGRFERFAFVDSPLLQPGLAAKYPAIKTYVVRSINGAHGANIAGRAVVSDLGLHVAIDTPEGMVFITRASSENAELYTSARASGVVGEAGGVLLSDDPELDPALPHALGGGGGGVIRPLGDPINPTERIGRTLSVYTLAMSACGEYGTRWSGSGTTTVRVGRIVEIFTTIVSTLNVVYEREVCTRFVLPDNVDQLVFLEAASDPYSAPTNGVATGPTITAAENQAAVDAILGVANYDLGVLMVHMPMQPLLSTAGAGISCVDAVKARAIVGAPNTFPSTPNADALTYELMARVIGRMLGGVGFTNPLLTPEPLGGSTIMSGAAYDTTPGDNNPDAFTNQRVVTLGWISFDQINYYVTTGIGAQCTDLMETGNTPPFAEAGPSYIIPAKTPYVLTGSGNDPDAGDVLTYSWESKNVGPVLDEVTEFTDNGISPINRPFPPTTSPSRQVPHNADLIDSTNVDEADLLPQVNRLMEWRLTVRDNHPGGGGIATDDTSVEVIGFIGPFSVLTPASGASVGGITTVTWDVASTDAPPISCENVRILLSTDGGETFPINLLNSTPNDGSATVALPNIPTTTARIKVESIGNIFFNITDGNFSIVAPPSGVSFRTEGQSLVVDQKGNGNGNGIADVGESALRLFVPIINGGSTAATTIQATLSTTTPNVTILSASSPYPPMPYGQLEQNSSPFIISIAPNYTCGQPITFRLTMTAEQFSGTQVINFTLPTGSLGGAGTPIRFEYVGNPVPIPNNDLNGVEVPFVVSNFGIVADVDFSFDGQAAFCTADIGNPFVGLAHPFVGDLVISLVSPSGKTVVLANRPGWNLAPGSGSSGNNICNLTFNDEPTNLPTIQSIAPAGEPYTGSFKPFLPLSAFDGENGNGTWKLVIADVFGLDTGSFIAGTLRLSPNNPPGCAATLPTGSCCVAAACEVTNANDCASQNGVFGGNGSSCSPNPCQAVSGACCVGSSCVLAIDAGACSGQGGVFIGAGAACNTGGNLVTPCCKADFNHVDGVTVQDIFDYLAAWFNASSAADINGEGGVTIQDLFDFINAWFARCDN